MQVKPSIAKEILQHGLRNRRPILLVGPPGSAKTDLNRQATELEGQRMMEMHPAVAEPTDFKGQPFVLAGRADFLPYHEMRQLIDAKEATNAFFDDYGHALPAVQAATMHLLLARRIGEHKVSDKVTFTAATNLRKHKAGVTALLEPVKSRFITIVEVGVDLEEWIAWAIGHSVPMEVVACIRYRPELLTAPWQPAPDDQNSCSPRTIAHAGELFKWGMSKEATYPAICGAAGEGFAVEFMGFLRFWASLPDPDEILAFPDTTPIPTLEQGLAGIYALAGALAQKARRNTADAICRVANRIPKEYAVKMISDCAQKGGKDFTQTAAYIQWETENAHLRV